MAVSEVFGPSNASVNLCHRFNSPEVSCANIVKLIMQAVIKKNTGKRFILNLCFAYGVSLGSYYVNAKMTQIISKFK